jgi:hypothetical protein
MGPFLLFCSPDIIYPLADPALPSVSTVQVQRIFFEGKNLPVSRLLNLRYPVRHLKPANVESLLMIDALDFLPSISPLLAAGCCPFLKSKGMRDSIVSSIPFRQKTDQLGIIIHPAFFSCSGVLKWRRQWVLSKEKI